MPSMSEHGFLDAFAAEIIKYCNNASEQLLPYVLGLMSVMLMWNIITNWDLYWGKQDFSKLIPLLVTATFFVALATSWNFVLNTVYEFGSEIAIVATSKNENKASIGSDKFLTTITPSMIISEGVDNAITVFKGHVLGITPSEIESDKKQEEITTKQVVKAMQAGISGNVMSGLVYAFITLLLFGFIAISYLYTVLEFFVIGSLSMVLLPFGLLDKTKAIVDKVLNYFFVSAIRIAIFLFLVLLINPAIKSAFKNASFVESAMGIDTLSAMISLFSLAFLAFKTPSFAAALFNGAINSPPSLTGISMQAVQTALLVKTLGTGKAAAAAKDGGEKAATGSVSNGSKVSSQTGSTAIETSRKDVIQDSNTTSSNKGSTYTQNNSNQPTDNTSSSDSLHSDTPRNNIVTTQKDATQDSGLMDNPNSKEQNTFTPTSESTTESPRQLVDNYQDMSTGSIKDDIYVEPITNSSTVNSSNNSRVQDMINAETETMQQQNQTSQTSHNHVKTTIQEFKMHELKSQEDK